VGKPLRIAEWRPPHAGGATEELTAEIDRRLREVTVNFRDMEQAGDVVTVSRLLADSAEVPEALGGGAPFSETVELTRRADAVRRSLAGADPAIIARADALRVRVRSIREVADQHDLLIGDAAIETDAGAAALFVAREAAITAVAGPLALWGRVMHWLPLHLARAIARRGSTSGADPAMYTVVSGVALVLAFYAFAGALVWHFAGPWWAVAFLVTLPVSAGWDFRLRDRAARARRRIRAFRHFRRQPELQRELLRQLAAAREEAVALERDVQTLVSGA